jgi:hypothetical protein
VVVAVFAAAGGAAAGSRGRCEANGTSVAGFAAAAVAGFAAAAVAGFAAVAAAEAAAEAAGCDQQESNCSRSARIRSKSELNCRTASEFVGR